jgi:hypothetical protein
VAHVTFGTVAHVTLDLTTTHFYQHELTVRDIFSWAVINVDVIHINLSHWESAQ